MAEVEFTWALDGYCARYGFLAQPGGADWARIWSHRASWRAISAGAMVRVCLKMDSSG